MPASGPPAGCYVPKIAMEMNPDMAMAERVRIVGTSSRILENRLVGRGERMKTPLDIWSVQYVATQYMCCSAIDQ